MPKETYIPSLMRLFRQYGYDGATLSKIAEATGLGKASLYHHFPGGKDEMVESVLDYTTHWLNTNILEILAAPGEPVTRLQRMVDRVNALYDGGNQPCLLAMLQAGSGRDIFHEQVKARLELWIGAIATVLVEAGMDDTLARERAEDAIIAIQGALIVSQGLSDPSPFQRVMRRLPEETCRPVLGRGILD